MLAAGDAGDVDDFDDLLHSNVVVHAPAGLSTESAQAEKQVWREALAAMPDLRHEVQEVVVDRMDQAVITHLRDGKVEEAWEIADVAALRQQVEAPG